MNHHSSRYARWLRKERSAYLHEWELRKPVPPVDPLIQVVSDSMKLARQEADPRVALVFALIIVASILFAVGFWAGYTFKALGVG